jgi:hypothetical protein
MTHEAEDAEDLELHAERLTGQFAEPAACSEADLKAANAMWNKALDARWDRAHFCIMQLARRLRSVARCSRKENRVQTARDREVAILADCMLVLLAALPLESAIMPREADEALRHLERTVEGRQKTKRKPKRPTGPVDPS